MTIDNKIIASIISVILASLIGQFLYSLRMHKKKSDERTTKQMEKVFSEIEKQSIHVEETKGAMKDLGREMVKNFGDIKVYMVENFAKRDDLNQIARDNREEHNNIYKKINGA